MKKIISLSIILLIYIIFISIKAPKVLIHGKLNSISRFGNYIKEEYYFYNNNKYKFLYQGKSEFKNSIIVETKSGIFKFKDNLIFIDDSVLKGKVIIKNNEIEFIDKFKIELIKNVSKLKNPIYYNGFKDYSFFTFSEEINYNLNTYEVKKFDLILTNEINSKNEKFLAKDYMKKCKAYVNKSNQIIVKIHGYVKNMKMISKNIFDNNVSDGGCNFFNAEINLTTGKVIYFHFHGLA